MIRTIILTSLLFAGCIKNPTKTEIDPDSGFQTTYTIRPEDEVPHGPYTKSDSSGILLERGHYYDGQLHGIREILFSDGMIKIRERYHHGQINDLYEYFFPNGKVELQGYYVGGSMYGQWKKYDDKGNLLERVTLVNNEEKGPFIEFYENGKIQAEGVYLNGPNEEGELKLYNESGELYKTMLCNSGKCFTSWEKI